MDADYVVTAVGRGFERLGARVPGSISQGDSAWYSVLGFSKGGRSEGGLSPTRGRSVAVRVAKGDAAVVIVRVAALLPRDIHYSRTSVFFLFFVWSASLGRPSDHVLVDMGIPAVVGVDALGITSDSCQFSRIIVL